MPQKTMGSDGSGLEASDLSFLLVVDMWACLEVNNTNLLEDGKWKLLRSGCATL